MSRHPRLSLIRNSYYFRARLPARLRRALSITEIRVNLKTDSRREATNRAGFYHFLFERMTNDMTDSEQLRLLELDVARNETKFEERSTKLKAVERQLKELVSWIKNINAEQITFIRLAEYANFIKRHLSASLLRSEGIDSPNEARALIDSMRLAMDYLEPELEKETPLDESELIAYKRKFKTEFLQIWQQQIQKIKTNRVSAPEPILNPNHQTVLVPAIDISPASAPVKKISFTQLHEEELTTKKVKSLKRQNSTNSEYFRYAEKFDILLDGLSICELTVSKVESLYDDLLNLKKSKGAIQRSPTREDLLTSDYEKRLTFETIEKHSIRLNTLLKFAKQKGYINLDLSTVDKASIASLMTDEAKTKKHDEEENAEPFTDSEIEKIFDSYLYNKEKSRNIRTVYPYHYFFPFLGAFTGCRINELAQLDVDDIVTASPYPHIKIEGDIDSNVPGSRSLKNEPSKRKIPIHPKLIELGFLEYVAQRKASKEKKLWDGLSWKEKGHYGALATQFFCRLDGPGGYLHHLGIHQVANDKKNFHSFRHTLITKLRNEAIVNLDSKNTEMLIESITGHSAKVKNTSDEYGIHTLERKMEVISRISYGNAMDVMNYASFYKRYRTLITHSIAKFKRGPRPKKHATKDNNLQQIQQNEKLSIN
ncbi:site-specific integrase [Pseudomonas putida]|uniref:site-specific integrase n=1 Tax=Pseudomonas putida TaxID=303 RepID=UPI001CD2D262|nr:site-specific integrase [Pseudomonas putida]